MVAKRNLAWHFVGETLRDGSPIPKDGVWLEHKGPLVLCKSGLHWSRQPFDALTYAPGETLCLDQVGGKIIENAGDDKGISSRRKIVVRMDATELLRYFARHQALSVVHLWEKDPADCVLDYLMGDDAARDAAYAASAAASGAAYATSEASYAASAAAYAASDPARDAAIAAAYAASDSASPAAREHFNSLVYEAFGDWL